MSARTKRKRGIVNKRVSIKWDKSTDKGLTGIITLDCWDDDALIYESPSKTYRCKCNVSKNSVGMTGIGRGSILPLSEEQLNQVKEQMRAFCSGWSKETSIYCWLPKE